MSSSTESSNFNSELPLFSDFEGFRAQEDPSQPLMSLAGHATEVDCVMFDGPEELVAAGSRGGSVKLWDLAHEKLVRTLTGHRASIRCMDFHPYGDFFARYAC